MQYFLKHEKASIIESEKIVFTAHCNIFDSFYPKALSWLAMQNKYWEKLHPCNFIANSKFMNDNAFEIVLQANKISLNWRSNIARGSPMRLFKILATANKNYLFRKEIVVLGVWSTVITLTLLPLGTHHMNFITKAALFRKKTHFVFGIWERGLNRNDQRHEFFLHIFHFSINIGTSSRRGEFN